MDGSKYPYLTEYVKKIAFTSSHEYFTQLSVPMGMDTMATTFDHIIQCYTL